MKRIGRMRLKNGQNVDWLAQKMARTHVLITNDVYEISRRLREYDETYFILLKKATGQYEVHNADNVGSTYCLTVPHDTLDQRTIDLVRSTDTQRIGVKERMDQIMKEEQDLEEAKKKETKNVAEAMARETADDIIKTCSTL